jgi:uncharacterized protein (TIGR02600 family)
MKPNIQPVDRKFQRRQRAIALITVLSVLAIMTIMAVAMLTLSMNETKSANKYADGEKASALADSVVSLVMGQIWDATKQQAGAARAIWASQPGAIRRYNLNGGFQTGYKLYSTDTMVVNGGAEAAMIADVPPAEWATLPGKWVDLNEPVIRPTVEGGAANEVIFPIIDPRAFCQNQLQADGSAALGSLNVEGFWYDEDFAGANQAANPLDNEARLPMPVQWLYLLRDGTIGWMTGNGNSYQFVSQGGGQPSEENPMVGRIAFWTDDESCKVNINTAGEPTPWSLPVTYHQRDYQYAMFPPTRYEYQRYPGHPATVALSSVLFPHTDFDTYGRTAQQRAFIVALKERIYDIMPKINNGGSQAGTIPFWVQSDPNYYAGPLALTRVDIANSMNERLYASIDELTFSQLVVSGNRLTQNSRPGALPVFGIDGRSYVNGGAAAPVIPENRVMDRLRFFLTAHSRAPEVNLHGGPRVAIWPVANEVLGPQFRTGYDNAITFCSSLGGAANSYIFRRQDSDSMRVDAEIPRNAQLLNYLYALMNRPYPSGGAAAASFTAKFGPQNSAQVLVEIFDYIRSTNLYDGALAPSRNELLNNNLYRLILPNSTANSGNGGTIVSHFDRFVKRDELENAGVRRTYTKDRASSRRVLRDDDNKIRDVEELTNTAFPGHGQVVPARATIAGQTVQGFGRFVTLSEIGLHFICTADGTPDDGSWEIRQPGQPNPPVPAPAWPVIGGRVPNYGSIFDPYSPDCIYSGGRTSTRLSDRRLSPTNDHTSVLTWSQVNGRGTGDIGNRPARWFSNFPPLRRRLVGGLYGVPAGAGSGPRSTGAHPGYDPRNWNYTLDPDRPLRPGERRVQGSIGLELTVPASGYIGIFPEFCIKISGLDKFRLLNPVNENDTRLFKSGDTVVLRSGSAMFSPGNNNNNGARVVGGSISPSNISEGRRARKVRLMEDDAGRAGVPNGPTEDPMTGKSYFYSNCFDLLTDFFTVGDTEMKIGGGSLNVELYAGMDPSDTDKLVQVFEIPWPSQTTVPTPQLVVVGVPAERYQNANGQVYTINRVEAPHWWSFHRDGALGRGTPMDDGRRNSHGGRLYESGGGHNESRRDLPRDHELIWGQRPSAGTGSLGRYTDLLFRPQQPERTPGVGASGYISPDVQRPYGQDSVFSMVVKHGDTRLTACLPVVGPEHWTTHPRFGVTGQYMAHSFVRHNSNAEAGFSTGEASSATRLVPFAPYGDAVRPDLAATREAAAAQAFGDFDQGVGPLRDGAWINKADEGNTGVAADDNKYGSSGSEVRRIATAYFDDNFISSESGEAFMSPNRMISSAVLFGSLPAAVHNDGATGRTPWRTLLFRPFTAPPGGGGAQGHPGSPGYGVPTQFNGVNPADHYLLDLFWMPVVEPYAISEPLSTAGKINLNYQMLPFHNYITRATGLHAALKGEMLTAIPTADAGTYKRNPTGAQSMLQVQAEFGPYWEYAKWSEDPAYAAQRYQTDFDRNHQVKLWHRKIEVEKRVAGAVQGTLAQFQNRFNFAMATSSPGPTQGLFRTASQICEVHLMPQTIGGTAPPNALDGPTAPPPTDGSDPGAGGGGGQRPGGGGGAGRSYQPEAMENFWQARAITGDNTKERVYASLYPKLTTQSNTFRVHYRVQVIRKARSVNPNTFDPRADTVASDQRGSVLIERRIDPRNPLIPDYAAVPGAMDGNPLDNFYKFRVLEQKRFNP